MDILVRVDNINNTLGVEIKKFANEDHLFFCSSSCPSYYYLCIHWPEKMLCIAVSIYRWLRMKLAYTMISKSCFNVSRLIFVQQI